MNTCDKFYWVCDHPKFAEFGGASIHLEPQMVNPLTKEIDDDTTKNTELNWWLEVTYYDYEDDRKRRLVPCHPYQLDTGGVTVDEAIDKLYKLTLEHYGDYDEHGVCV